MTKAEKLSMREMFARQQVGWDFLAVERIANIKATDTPTGIRALASAFAYSQTLPPRSDSGFVQFYKALARVGR